MQGRLLPIEAIKAEIMESVSQQIEAEDRGQSTPPEWWDLVGAEFDKLVAGRAETAFRDSLLASVRRQIAEKGERATGGLVMKLLVIGWRMAELYLERELEKTAAS